MRFFADSIVLVNIAFSAVLLFLVVFLIVFHAHAEAKNKKTIKLEEKIYKLISKADISANDIKKLKAIYTLNGLRALETISKKMTPEQIYALNEALSNEKFFKFVKKNLNSKHQSNAILTTKLIIALRFEQFTEDIVYNLKRWNDNSEAQQISLLALFVNGCKDELVELMSDSSFKLLISFRTSQELVASFSGDKIDFYNTLINCNCDNYIKRACIQIIGNENIVQLSEEILKFIDSENLNLLISSIKTLGNLKYTPIKERLVVMLQDANWEITCAIVETLAKIDPINSYEIIFPFIFHEEWWVRFRTSEALALLPDNERLLRDVKLSQDKYAIEMVSYMLERKKLMKAGEING